MIRLCLTAVLAVPFLAGGLPAQSITAGALRGKVLHTDGSAMTGAVVTIENSTGGTFKNLESGDDGTFGIRMMLPGTYRILVEMVGYQPVRQVGVIIAAGRTTAVSITLVEKPPPITTVTEIQQSGTSAGAMGRVLTERELRLLDARRDATDISRAVTEVAGPRDGRYGFAQMASGLPGSYTRLFVDGVPEQLLRHPGVPSEASATPLFQRDGVDQAQIFGSTPDLEWRGVAGSVLGLETRRGTNKALFAPYATFSSASLGGKKDLNPADSAGTSFQFGATVSGALVPDTAHYFFRADYQSLETPAAFPWASDTSRYLNQSVLLSETLRSIATDSFNTSLNAGSAPVVRTWKGGSGSGRLDWQLSPLNAIMARAGFTSWKETNTQLGEHPGNDAGVSLSARDLSGAVSLTSAGPSFSNELRIGFSAARREWTAPNQPVTTLVGEGVGVAGNPAAPALFDVQVVSFSDGFQLTRGRHSFRAGGSVDHINYRQNYRYGALGLYQFGDLDRFGSAAGTFYQATATTAETKFAAPELGLYVEDAFTLSPELSVVFGIRYQVQVLPKNKITANQAWFNATGLHNDSLPRDRRGFQPRIGFVWDVQNKSEWLVQGSAGLYSSGIDPATFAEVMLNDGDVTVRRGQGTFATWPALPGSAEAASVGPRLTYFSGAKSFRAPRTFKGDLGISRALRGGLTLQIAGSYHHSDYLLRRTDLNRSASSSGLTQEGRPVFGTLVQQGGLVSPRPTTGRRFGTFDMVSVLAPTGFSDHYELTASLDRPVGRTLSLMASYTYAHTRDNLVGLLSADPADQLSPFPEGVAGAVWDEGRSDLDITHRVASTLEYSSKGRTPVSLAVRARWRSGLPFTPGFRRGVDVNGDLSGGNDPVQATSVPAVGPYASCSGGTVGGFAERNGCRDKSVGSVDLRLAVGLPVKAGDASVKLTVDAFNVAATSTGIVDHAAMLIDPTKTLTTDANGGVTLPLVANPRFGQLLSRRGEPRLVRFGLRVEY